MNRKRKIESLLRQFGTNHKYIGFYYTAEIVDTLCDNPERLAGGLLSLCASVEESRDAGEGTVVRAIYRVVKKAYSYNKPLLETLIGHTLSKPPKPRDFLDALMAEALREEGGDGEHTTS